MAQQYFLDNTKQDRKCTTATSFVNSSEVRSRTAHNQPGSYAPVIMVHCCNYFSRKLGQFVRLWSLRSSSGPYINGRPTILLNLMQLQLDLSPPDANSSQTDFLKTMAKMVETYIKKQYLLWDLLTDLLDSKFPKQWELVVPSQAVI